MVGVGTGVQQDLDHEVEGRAVRLAERGMERGLSGFRIGVVRIGAAFDQVSAQFPVPTERGKAQSEVGTE
jgi:hypothetical protein